MLKEKSIKWWKKAIKQNDSNAQYYLGNRYYLRWC